ncbi:MAG: serine--tRNA ligase [Campylobacterales bacterium]
MIDAKELQKNFEVMSDKLINRGVDEEILKNLRSKRETLVASRMVVDELKAQQNKKSKLFPEYKKQGRESELKEELNTLKQSIQEKDEIARAIEEEFLELTTTIPNIPDDDVPYGESEEENVEIKRVLEPTSFDFTPKEHWELAELNGWIDFSRGAKLAGSRFSVFKQDGAKLVRALINYMLDFNSKRGFAEVMTPVIANSASLFGTGQLPKFENDLYKIEGDEGFYLIPTAEVTLTNMYRDEIIEASSLPLKMTSYTNCFRREAGSGGRDIRGIIRQHQFDKVEIVSICKQEQSDEVFEEMVECASDLLTSLGLPHRLVMLCSGDLGFGAAKTIDIEVWLPGQETYREISSISNTRDFQARRAKIRYKEDKKNILAHTLNGSSLAVGRTLVAIMENFQNDSGEIEIPEVLKEYI